MPEAWRIIKERHVPTAFSGEGAAKVGGRWNSRGIPVVYTSGSRALAALELLVHLNPPIHFALKMIRVEFSAELVHSISVTKMPEDWRLEPAPPSTKQIGDTWVKELRSVILAVPSVIIPDEINYLLNPSHPDIKKVTIGKPVDFSFDSRLLS